MILSFLTVPILLSYLGVDKYGVWVVIFSVVNWIYNFDLGVGNSLRNKLTESLSMNDFNKASQYISNTLISLTIISLVVFVVCYAIVFNINIGVFFKNYSDISELRGLIVISVLYTLLNFIFNVYRQLYYSVHKSSFVYFSFVVYQISLILSLLLFREYLEPNLKFVAILFGALNCLVSLIFFAWFLFLNKSIKISLSLYSIVHIREILNVGGKFFVIQLCMLVVFTTDNLIVSSFFGPESVASYSILMRVFFVLITISSVVLTPFWSMFTSSYTLSDYRWIRNALKNLHYLFLALVVTVFILYFYVESFIELWLGYPIVFPEYLIFLSCVFVLLRVYSDIHMTFLNSIGDTGLQMYIYIFSAIFNIPVSIFLIKYTSLGVSSVLLATNSFLLIFSIVLPIKTLGHLSKVRAE